MPSNLAVFVTSPFTNQIFVSDPALNAIRNFSLPVTGTTPVPTGIAKAYDNSGVWIVDQANTSVVKCKWDGTVLTSFDPVMTQPEGIAINQTDGRIYVCDRGTGKNVKIFTPEGVFISEFGGPYSGPGGPGWFQSHPIPNSSYDIPPPMEIDAPGVRRFFAAAYDETRNVMVMFGGQTGIVTPTLSTDTWTWDGTTFTLMTPAHSPAADAHVTMCWHPASSKIVLLNTAGETWTWDGTDWTKLTPVAHPPSGSGSMALDVTSGKIVFIVSSGGPAIDTWTWNGTNWTQEAPAAHPTGAPVAITWDYVNNYVIGFGFGSGRDETWKWDGTNWTHLTPATTPTARIFTAISYHTVLARVVLFGGTDPGGGHALGDTWMWDGIDWTLSPISGPTIDYGLLATPRAVTLVRDPDRGAIWLYGGYSALNVPIAYGDTWSLTNVAVSGTFSDPGGIAIDPVDSTVYVGDLDLNICQKFTDTGDFILAFGSTGTGNGQFGQMEGVAVAADQTVWITDCRFCVSSSYDRWQSFSNAGVYQSQFTKTFAENDVGLAINPVSGDLYSCVTAFATVIYFNIPAGTFVGGHGNSEGAYFITFAPRQGSPVFNNTARAGT